MVPSKMALRMLITALFSFHADELGLLQLDNVSRGEIVFVVHYSLTWTINQFQAVFLFQQDEKMVDRSTMIHQMPSNVLEASTLE